MALRRDGSSKRSASFMPYDSSNSLVRRIANKVTGLVGWRSQSPSSVSSQNYDSLSNSTDEDNVSPTPKRIRMQSDEEDTSFKLIPCTSRGTSELCSPIPPVNNIKAVSTHNRNPCFVASTPADVFSSTILKPNSKRQTQDSNVIDSFDNTESANISSSIPQFTDHQRHNITVPVFSRDASSQQSILDSDRKTRYSSNPRKPTFNIDTFSNSSKRLSMSVCESRHVNNISPFYAARTLYGGASALLPYNSQSRYRLRTGSSSSLDLFAPRSQTTIKPMSPSPNNCNNDQETMSAAARRILDTIEKFCSPVRDAKKIPLPVRESRTPSGNVNTSQTTPSQGMKRKLPSLDQMTPSTAGLLRIKRQEKMQDSVSSARQVISAVSEKTIAAEDSDASSDSSTDLDYSILASDTNTKHSQKYVGKTRRKDDKVFDHSPLPPLKLPNAVLKITNLPKFDIIDTFTFSKPILLENLEQDLTEENSESIAGSAVTDNSNSLMSQTSSAASNDNKSASFRQSTASAAPSSERVVPSAMSMVTSPQRLTKPASSWSCTYVSPKTVSPKRTTPTKRTTPPWTCKYCLLESTTEICPSCGCTRIESITPEKIPPLRTREADSKSSTTLRSGWGDKFKVTSDMWECKECFVRNANAINKCVACESPKPGAPSTPAIDNVVVSSSNELWKNAPKPATSAWSFGIPAKDTIDSVEKPIESAKPAVMSFGFGRTDTVLTNDSTNEMGTDKKTSVVSLPNDVASSSVMTKPTYSFGLNTTSTSSNAMSTINSSNDNATKNIASPVSPPGDTNVKTSFPATFTFGVDKSSDATDPGTCNAVGMKMPSTDMSSSKSESEKFNDLRRSASVFNGVSSITNNTRNPLLKTAPETGIANDPSLFKMPKTTTSFETASANKENGDDVGASNTLFNPASAAGTESPSKKKNTNILFQSYGSPGTVTANIFGNGFTKADMNSNAALINSNPTTAIGSSVTNVFTSSLTPSKPTNDVQVTPSFGIVPNKVESISANENSKSSKLFSGASNFNTSLAPQQQQTTSNSMFGSFGGTKLDSQVAINAAPMFNFGSNNSAVQPAAVSQQPPSGGFSFNGPKAEDTNFVFGGMANANFTTTNTLHSANPPQFTNPNASGPAPPQFSFSSSLANDQTKPMNSIFASATPSLKDYQTNSNSVPTFGNSMFGNTSQQPSQMNTTKKPGGFSFPAPPTFGSQSVNSFGNFGNVAPKHQDQSTLNSNATPGTSPYVFGSASLPTTFNFTGGNAVPTFSAQPTAVNNVPSTGLPQRKIKKAVRRTAK